MTHDHPTLREQHEGSAAGVDLAARAIRAIAAGDEAGALDILNSSTLPEARWGAAYLLVTLRQAALAQHKGNARKACQQLLQVANGAAEDAVMTGVRLAARDVERSL